MAFENCKWILLFLLVKPFPEFARNPSSIQAHAAFQKKLLKIREICRPVVRKGL
jgi:hypothetical protein